MSIRSIHMSLLHKALRRTLLKLGNAASLTDVELLARFAATQEQTAVEELVRRHGPVVLCYFEGKTNEEAARLLRCPAGTIYARLSRARELLRNRLARQGVTLSVGGLASMLMQEAASAALPVSLTAAVVRAAAGSGIG